MGRITILGSLLVLLCTGPARAEMLLDTGPGPNTPIGYGVSGPNSPYGINGYFQSLAGEFTSQDWTITGIKGWMAASGPAFNFPPGPVTLNVSIYSDANGAPGSRLLTSPFGPLLCASAAQSSCPVGWQGPTTPLSWTLGRGTYWVVFEGIDGDTGWVGMPGPVSAPLARSLFETNTQSWSELYPGGFGVEISGVKPVPLPAAALLLLSGLGGFGAVARFRRAA